MDTKTSFWENKPVKLYSGVPKQLLKNKEILAHVKNELDKSKFKNEIQTNVYISTIWGSSPDNIDPAMNLSEEKLNFILKFINKNYITSFDNDFKLKYSLKLLRFFATNCDLILIEFIQNDETIGCIMGKKEMLSVKGSLVSFLEVNFLCLVPEKRNQEIAPYMINALTKESLERYKIAVAHYTISTDIKCDHYSLKNVYHRPLAMEKLSKAGFLRKNINVPLYKKIYNTFQESDHFIVYVYDFDAGNEEDDIDISSDTNSDSNSNLILKLYNKYIKYCSETFEIYEHISFYTFHKVFSNDAFSNFVEYDVSGKIVSYFCIYRLDTINIENKNSYKNGYIYYAFFENKTRDSIISSIEFLCSYVHRFQLFDIITYADIFRFEKYDKIIRGCGKLKYYLFNYGITPVDSWKNGLITI